VRRSRRRARYDSRVTCTNWSHIGTVFLDRDGVLNRKAPDGEYIARWEDFTVLDGVPEALARLQHAGLRVLVVTNQRGAALGRYSAADVDAIHSRFQQLLSARSARIDAFYVCPHDHGECDCRKPLPGLFRQAVADFPAVSPESSVMIGDSLVDMEFGRRLGMRTILIEDGSADRAPGIEQARAMADLRCPSLREAVSALLGLE
jgi:D-glycero-D-manno-heptose 1,7-bisphosphate phosphatase